MDEQRALEAVGMSKRYGDRHAVRGVDLVVRPGEIHGLLGPNGAGKTTLLRMLLGLVRPDSGTVRVLGQTTGATGCPLPDGMAGFVDSPRFYPYLSGRRNLSVLLRLDRRLSRAREKDLVTEALERVSLTSAADVKLAGYSAGMRQRLGLASALVRSPRLLLLDEPTNSLDPAGARELAEQVRRLAADGVAVLLSSHDMAEVEALCASVTILRQGRVAFSGSVDDLRKRTPSALFRLRTGDDARALTLAASVAGVEAGSLAVAVRGAELEVTADEGALDAYVIALGTSGIAVRELEPKGRSLESLFLRLTSDAVEEAPAPPTTEPAPVSAPLRREGRRRVSARAVLDVIGVEHAKLRWQPKTWAALAVCVLGPFVFAVAMRVQGALPEDTLFGRWAKASGFAVGLVVLGFAALWGLPVLASLVGGDLFSAEDRYGTWPGLLTRSRSRGEIFTGKVLAALTFSLAVVLALALSSTAAGLLVIGHQPLLDLSGRLLPADQSLTASAEAWVSVLPPVFGFTTLALLLSTATRSSAAGIGLPVLLALVMQLSSCVNLPVAFQAALLTPPFVAWHGLFTEHPYYGPLMQGAVTSGVYALVCLALAYAVFRRRDVGSGP